jgi:hypothetical protein
LSVRWLLYPIGSVFILGIALSASCGGGDHGGAPDASMDMAADRGLEVATDHRLEEEADAFGGCTVAEPWLCFSDALPGYYCLSSDQTCMCGGAPGISCTLSLGPTSCDGGDTVCCTSADAASCTCGATPPEQMADAHACYSIRDAPTNASCWCCGGTDAEADVAPSDGPVETSPMDGADEASAKDSASP